MAKPTKKSPALPKTTPKPQTKLSGAPDQALNAKADAVVSRLNKPKPVR